VDLAREHGLSAQAVRNYERKGILPPAERTPSGYRVYTPLHARALRAFVALVPAHGHRTAAGVMRAVNAGDVDGALALLDESHAQLLSDRETLAAVDAALRDLASSEPSITTRRKVVFIGQLARELGVGPATLRKWEKAGLIEPRRDPETGYRVYGTAEVRDAHLAHQLRRGGYLLRQISPLIARVRQAGGIEPLETTIEGWRARLTTRGLSMLAAATELSTYLEDRGHLPPPLHGRVTRVAGSRASAGAVAEADRLRKGS
jgi:DNA-binding transcriptional MerR regulator